MWLGRLHGSVVGKVKAKPMPPLAREETFETPRPFQDGHVWIEVSIGTPPAPKRCCYCRAWFGSPEAGRLCLNPTTREQGTP